MREQLSLNKENIISPRERLLKLEKEGRYVFHGSTSSIDCLEPRQAYNNNEKDGLPAVFATPFADVAIYRSLINGNNLKELSINEFGITEKGIYFRTSKNLLDFAQNLAAKVYVLDREKFEDFKGTQCRSREPIIPIEVVEVTAKDLPSNIEIIEANRKE